MLSETDPSNLSRCPGCGEPLAQPTPPHCPLCAYTFEDSRATSRDLTPYAIAYESRERRWGSMLLWVFFAGSARLKHLAMMRASPASRRFARTNLLLLVFGLGLLAWTHTGWTRTGGRLARESGSVVRPDGEGWVCVAAAPRPLPDAWPVEARTELWWNSAQAIVAVLVATITAWLMVCLWSVAIRLGVRSAHQISYRGEQRMTAALHYGTAWIVPLLAALILYAIQPVSYLGEFSKSGWIPPREFFTVTGGGIGGIGLALWWFWLIRLGFSAPVNTRGRVVVFFAVGVPALTAALLIGWWRALPYALGPLFRAMSLEA